MSLDLVPRILHFVLGEVFCLADAPAHVIVSGINAVFDLAREVLGLLHNVHDLVLKLFSDKSHIFRFHGIRPLYIYYRPGPACTAVTEITLLSALEQTLDWTLSGCMILNRTHRGILVGLDTEGCGNRGAAFPHHRTHRTI